MANNFKPIGGGGGGALDIPSDQVFDSTSERDAYFTANPSKLVDGAQCVVLTSPPEGLYQVYTDGAWENRSAIIQGSKGDKGDKGDDGNDGNPNEGFVLDQNASIGMTDSEGNADTIITYTPNDDCVFGDFANRKRTVIKSTDRLYINITNEQGQNATLGVLDDSDRVNVDGVESPNIQTGPGLESVDNGDGTVTIETSGQEEVVEYNVDDDPTINLTASAVGKFISVTQTSQAASIMQFYVDDHNLFRTGDTIKIGASDSYVNYFFSVFYYDANGQAFAIYPNNNCQLVRTETSWDIQQDGRFTKTAIRPRNQLNLPYSGSDPDNRPVQAFVFANHPAVGYEEDDEGNRIMVIDFYKIAGDPDIDSVDIAHTWTTEEFPTKQDIKDALLFAQTDDDKTATFDVAADSLPLTTMYAKRSESSAKYLFFAYPADFFVDVNGDLLEPTVVNTGAGNSPDWVVSTVDVDGINYRVQRSPTQNFGDDLPNCKLIQTS